MISIETLRKELNEFNTNNELSINNGTQEPTRNMVGNQFDLNNFQFRVSYLEYQKSISKSKKDIKTKPLSKMLETQDDLERELGKNRFDKPWSKLDIFAKKTKIKEYLEDKYPNNVSEYMLILEPLLQNKKLNKKTDVNYDSENEKIININHLNI